MQWRSHTEKGKQQGPKRSFSWEECRRNELNIQAHRWLCSCFCRCLADWSSLDSSASKGEWMYQRSWEHKGIDYRAQISRSKYGTRVGTPTLECLFQEPARSVIRHFHSRLIRLGLKRVKYQISLCFPLLFSHHHPLWGLSCPVENFDWTPLFPCLRPYSVDYRSLCSLVACSLPFPLRDRRSWSWRSTRLNEESQSTIRNQVKRATTLVVRS